MKTTFFGMSDIGCRRSNNEDAFILQHIWDENHLLAVVIDGCGGYEGGEYAAQLASKCILEHMLECPTDDYQEQLRLAVIYANNTIISQQYPPRHLMCCVLTAALIDLQKQQVHIAHIGDTRCYMYNHSAYIKLTKDHSVVGEMEDASLITEEQAIVHPRRNIITRCVGRNTLDYQTTKIDSLTIPFSCPSALLLCSDGLYDMLLSNEIVSILGKPLDTQNKVEELINKAKAAGGKDNITIILIEIV